MTTKLLKDKDGKSKAFKFKFSDVKPHERITILGKTGSGKSVLFSKMMEYLSKKTLIILADVKAEYNYIPTFELENLEADKGLFRCYEIKYKGHTITKPYDIVEFLSALLFERGYTDEKKEIYGKPAMLAVEEMASVVRKHGMLYDTSYNFARLLAQGRSREVGFLGTSQRPQQLHTDIISQSNHLICFDLTSKHDVEAVKSYFEPEWFDLLGKHQYFYLNFNKNTIQRCFKQYLSVADKRKFDKLFGKS